MHIYILTAGKSKKGLKPNGLKDMPTGQSVLDWQMNIFKKVYPVSNVSVLTGYKYEEYIKKFPNLNFIVNPYWEKTNAIKTLEKFSNDYDEEVLIAYGDTVFHEEVIESFSKIKSEIIIGIDSLWKKRFKERSKKDLNIAEIIQIKNNIEVEFTGLIKFRKNSFKKIKEILLKKNINNFIELIEVILKYKFSIKFFDVKGKWAELNESNDMVQFVLGTKAETLENLKTQLKLSYIGDNLIINYGDWKKSSKKIIKKIQRKFCNKKLAFRSSSFEEDNWIYSNAGEFKSILNVDSNDVKHMTDSVNSIFESYKQLKNKSQILVQIFISDVKLSGVLFTCDLNTGAPYFIIDYDLSGFTDRVTSGISNDTKVLVINKSKYKLIKKYDEKLFNLIEASLEISTLLNYNKLDIEFAIDKKNIIHIFQVRPIVVDHAKYEFEYNKFNQVIKNAQNSFLRWQKPGINILGKSTIFSNMADWNPAEMIGIHPNPLAISLYKYLITDEVWAKQRSEFGYKDVRPNPLLFTFCGQPFIDVRASFNSFIPKSIPRDTGKRIVEGYLECLKEKPYLHDKIEFEIAYTIWTPDFYVSAKKRLNKKGVHDKDLKLLEIELKKITKNALRSIHKIEINFEKLLLNFKLVKNSDLNNLEIADNLIKDCKEFGTINFSHAARLGFVAISFLNSFVRLNILTESRKELFLQNLGTILTDFEKDLTEKSIDDLVIKYGHLRPGTYEINRKAYWENPILYLKRSKNQNYSKQEFIFSKQEMKKINDFIKPLDNNFSGKELIYFIKESIKLREKLKFLFTRNVSLALDHLLKFGKNYNLNREQLSHLKWTDIEYFRTNSFNIDEFKLDLEIRRNQVNLEKLINLPPVIIDKDNFYLYEIPDTVPNFITNKKVVGKIVKSEDLDKTNLNGKIILIPEADPGYDWVFKYDISGLITIYGGANSHMSIRCAEKSIPAAIGIGLKYFDYIVEYEYVELDCENHFVKGKSDV